MYFGSTSFSRNLLGSDLPKEVSALLSRKCVGALNIFRAEIHLKWHNWKLLPERSTNSNHEGCLTKKVHWKSANQLEDCPVRHHSDLPFA